MSGGELPAGADEPAPKRQSLWDRLLLSFSGADVELLAEVRSEQNFYRRLGAAVLLLSCLSGLALTFALAFALRRDPASLWWVGLGWAAFMACGIEPLVLQISPTKKRLALAVAIAWRVALSVLLALQLSEPMILLINEPEINKQLAVERHDAEAASVKDAQQTFGPKIAKARGELQKIRDRVAGLQHNAAEYRYSASEAAAMGSCGPACAHYRGLAAQAGSKLRAIGERNRRRQQALHENLARWRKSQRGGEDETRASVRIGDGIWARIGAMDAIAARDPGQEAEIWALRLLLLVIDLLPLSAKVFRLFTVDSPYERKLAAKRAADMIPSKLVEARSRVATAEIQARERAEKEVRRAAIYRETEERIADTQGRPSEWSAPHFSQPHVEGWSLREFVDEISIHEAQTISVPVELNRAGLAATALIGVTMLLAILAGTLGGALVSGTWIAAICFAAIAALCLYTHGFRRAPGWALRGIVASFLVGLTLPFALLAANL